MKTTTKFTIVSLLGIVCLVGCVSPAIKSRHVKPETKEKEPIEGVAYVLPMVKIHLTAVLTNVMISDTNETFLYMPSVSNSYTRTVSFNQTNTNTVSVTNITTQVFSNSVLTTRFGSNTNRQAYVISIDPIICPDPNFLYALKKIPSKMSSDSNGISVDPTNNFLQSVNATNADQSIQIVDELAKAAATIASMGVVPAFPSLPPGALFIEVHNPNKETNPPTLRIPPPGRIEMIFDPTSSDELQEANEKLVKLLLNLHGNSLSDAENFSPIRLKTTFRGNPVSKKTAAYLSAHPPEKAEGVLYRPLLPYFLEVYNSMGEMGTNSVQYLVRSPNAAPVFSLPVNRGTFVTMTTAITFNNGFLQGVNYSNPSQVAALLGLPITVVGDIFSSVTNVLQLKLNIATAQSGIVTQQTALVNQTTALNTATTNLLESIKQLQAFKANQTNNP